MTGSSPNTQAWVKKLIRYRQNVVDAITEAKSGEIERNYTELRREIMAEIRDFNDANPGKTRREVAAHINSNTDKIKMGDVTDA